MDKDAPFGASLLPFSGIFRIEDCPLLASLLTGTGLSASCGLNAYLPLLILALADRFSSLIDLDGRWTALSSPWMILALLVILPVELIGDKIPKFDHINDILHTVIRPIAGGTLMAAIASRDDAVNGVVAFALGVAIAGLVHAFKFRTRIAVTAATAGIGNPIVSIVEDVAAALASIVAVVLPYGIVLVLPLAGLLVWKTWASLQSPSGRLSFLYRGRR